MVSDWKPIETAPKDARILLWNGSFVTAGNWDATFETFLDDEADVPRERGAWTDHTVADWGMEENTELFPTHWQPLPEPPA